MNTKNNMMLVLNMVGINNIDISQREFNYYKEWVERTQGISIEEHIGIIIKNKLQQLKQQKGNCNQRSIILEKGKLKGSCTWKDECKSYKIYLRGNGINIYYGFFESLYQAERELQSLFKNDEQEIIKKARKQQKHYRKLQRMTNNPKITDKTQCIKAIHNKKGSMVLKFHEPFINPVTKKQQMQITFGKNMLQYYNKKELVKAIASIDDPIELIEYKNDLINRLK